MPYQIKEIGHQTKFIKTNEIFVSIALAIGGLFFIGIGLLSLNVNDFLLLPDSIINFLPLSIGLLMLTICGFIYFGNNSLPRQIIFDSNKSIIIFQGDTERETLQVPLSYIDDFETEVEKKRPSQSNSAVIHHLVYHLIIVWKSGGKWHLTESTDQNKISEIESKLRSLLTYPSQTNFSEEKTIPSTVNITSGQDQSTVEWRSNKHVIYAVIITFINAAIIGSLWWLLIRSSSIERTTLIILLIMILGLGSIVNLISPSIFYKASTKFKIEITKRAFTYYESAKIGKRIKTKMLIEPQNIKEVKYSYSPKNLRDNSTLFVNVTNPKDNFSVTLAGLSPLQCLALELTIKELFKKVFS